MNTLKSIGELIVGVLVIAVLCWFGMVIFDGYGVGGLAVLCVLIIGAGLAALGDKN